MALRDLHNHIKVTAVINPQTQTNADTAVVGAIIDSRDYDTLEYVIQLGGVTDTDVTMAVLLEHGDDSGLSDAATVSTQATGLLGSIPAPTFASDNAIYKFGYVGHKRYTRVTVTPTGNNSGALPISAAALQTKATQEPVS